MNETHAPAVPVAEWHARAVDEMTRAVHADRLGHALLIGGVPGIGKSLFADWLAQYLLCRDRAAAAACGRCKSCMLYAAGTHPDLLRVRPEAPGKALRVDAIREWCTELMLTAQFAGYRVGVLEPADALNINAANSLLKTLEEPPARRLLILVSSHPASLSMTVRSRCQQLTLGVPEPDAALGWLQTRLGSQAERWLALARGAPLSALQMAEEGNRSFRDQLLDGFLQVAGQQAMPLATAASYARCDLLALLRILESCCVDLIRLRSAGNQTPLVNSDLAGRLRELAPRLDLRALFGYLDRIRSGIASAVSLNVQLATEELFVQASRLIEEQRKR